MEQKREFEKKMQEDKELEGATFRPNIHTSANKRMVRDKRIKTEDFLMFQGRLADEKKQRLKKDLERQEMEDVSFKPSIDKKSE